MSVTLSPSGNRTYGVTLVCRAWEIGRSNFCDWRDRRDSDVEPRRRAPRPAISDVEPAEAIRDLHARLEGRLRHPRRWVPQDPRPLAPAGSPRRPGSCPAGPARTRPAQPDPRRARAWNAGARRRITTDRPDEMWGTDATQALTLDEGTAWVFAAIDHCTGEIVGIHAAAHGTRFEALEPIHQGVRARFGEIDQGACAGLSLRHDHGTHDMSPTFQGQFAFLAIESSPSVVRSPRGQQRRRAPHAVPQGAAALIPRIRIVEDLRLARVDLQRADNESWVLACHGYRTPNQARAALVAAT